jgi:hypothetical protein
MRREQMRLIFWRMESAVAVRGGFGILVGDEVIDLLDQLAHVFEGAAADGALGDERESAFALI